MTALASAAIGGAALLLGLAAGAALEWRAWERPATHDRSLWPTWLLTALLAASIASACWPSRMADFEADDFGYMRLVHERPLSHFVRLGDMSEGLWGRPMDEMRPVFAVSLKLDDLLWGVDAPRQHLTNIALHTLNALLLVALVLALAPEARHAAWLAGLLFGLAPVHGETIGWISGRVDALPTAACLGVLVLFARFRRTGSLWSYGLAVVVYGLGIFAKETVLVLPALLLAYDLLLAPGTDLRSRWRPRELLGRVAGHLPFLVLAATLLVLRALLFGSAARTGRLNLGRLPWTLWERALPIATPFLEWVGTRPGAAAIFSSVVLLGAAVALLRALWRERERRVPSLALAVFFGAWYGLNLLPLLVTYPSARHLYLPTCGVAAVMALLVFPVSSAGSTRLSPARWLIALLLVAVQAHLLGGSLAEWVAAGRRSAGIREGMERAAGRLPPGTVVVLSGVPAETSRLMLWRWATPFALQPPFVASDVYSRLRVVEPPETYSRPVRDWWRARRPVVQALLTGDPLAKVEVYDAHWNAAREELVLRRALLVRGQLRERLDGALRRPVGSAAELSDAEASRLMRRLAEAVRQAAASSAAGSTP